ncbi:MAG: hypothetical protein KIS88_05930 [Anaerolineales bacterium]|nr:hypothetical protein [Anaerolineales bacterium]
MDAAALAAAATTALAAHGYQPAEGWPELDASYQRGLESLGLVLLAGRADAFAHLQAFEDGMQCLLAARQQRPVGGLALAVDLSAAAQRHAASYRRALNKYQNSVVFEDAGIGLLLAGSGDAVWLQPAEVNAFLRGLDRWLTLG